MKPVIRVLLCGGLGNQLFQYAFGRALSKHLNSELQIDIRTGFARDIVYNRNYELGAFQLSNTASLMHPSCVGMQLERLKLALSRRGLYFNGSYLLESKIDNFNQIDQQFRRRRRMTLFGYWQDIRYFAAIENQLREDLRFVRKLSVINQATAKEMQAIESVAIHVRRAQYDYATGLDYYNHAISQMLENIPNARLYCFGDDLDWCRENLQSRYSVKLIDNHNLPSEDFQLMTNCKHYITADSSFSWWAAWIGGANGYVTAPKGKGCRAYENAEKSPKHWQFI